MLRRLVAGLARLLGGMEPVDTRGQEGPGRIVMSEPTAPRPAMTSPPLQQTLARFESMPQELAELKRALGEVFHRLEDAIDHLGIEARRLSNEASALSLVADRLQARLGDLGRSLGQERPHDWSQPAPQPPASEEPQFRPSDRGVSVVLAAVPGFQGLMEVQRALSRLPEAEGASVVAYRNGEASLEVMLQAPLSARRIVEELRESTGQQLLIEEARPDAQKLRLRFVPEEGRR